MYTDLVLITGKAAVMCAIFQEVSPYVGPGSPRPDQAVCCHV